MKDEKGISRRSFLKSTGVAVAIGTAAGSLLKGTPAYAQASSSPVKIGVILPFSGSYKVIGDRVQAGLELAIHMAGGQVKGRKFTIIKEDSEMKPDVGLTKTKKLVEKDKVDFLVGPVSSAVFVVMRNYATEKKVVQIVPTAGNIELAGNLYSPYIFRSSISHWIFAHPMGYWVYDNLGTDCFVAGANYAAGQHQVWAFTMSYRGKGGKVIGAVYPPLNEKDYSSYITKIADSGAKAYYGWFAGNDAVNFCRQADQFGLSKKVKMSTSGWFFEDNLLAAQKETAVGWFCNFNWTRTLNTPFNKEFISQYNKFTKNDQDVAVSMSSVHGYDAGQMIVKSLEMTGGDTSSAKVINALEQVKLVSPRGDVWLDSQHELVQPMYIAEIVKSGSEVEPKIIANLGHWTTPLLGANGVSSVGQPFIIKG
jgi:branched-chain amino acid transport system substrate-binding protein